MPSKGPGAKRRRRQTAGGRYSAPKDQSGLVRLPTTKLTQLLLEMCRSGPALNAETGANGDITFAWSAPSLGTMSVRVPAADAELAALMRTVTVDSHIYVELIALLTEVLRVNAVVDGFTVGQVLAMTLGRSPGAAAATTGPKPPSPAPAAPEAPTKTTPTKTAAERRHGTRARALLDGCECELCSKVARRKALSHPERHSPHVRALLRLLCCDWHIALSKDDPSLSGWTAGPLVTVAAGRAHRFTVTLAPGLREAFTSFTNLTPTSTFSLRDPAHQNREGNLPSLAHKARIRIAGAITQRKRGATGRRVRVDEILDIAGIDSQRYVSRGRIARLVDTCLTELGKLFAAGGPGLHSVPGLERPLLRMLIALSAPIPPEAGAATPSGP
jgi:hypothetical protein